MSRRIRIAAGIVIAAGVVLLIELRSTPRVPVEDPLGPYGLPRVLAIGLVLSGLAMLVPVRRPEAEAEPEAAPEAELEQPVVPNRFGLSPSAVTVIAAVGYVVALSNLGFIVSTLVLGLILLPALGARSRRSVLAVPVVVTLLFLLVFGVALDVHLPTFLGR
jgi:hypothetical protein